MDTLDELMDSLWSDRARANERAARDGRPLQCDYLVTEAITKPLKTQTIRICPACAGHDAEKFYGTISSGESPRDCKNLLVEPELVGDKWFFKILGQCQCYSHAHD